MSFIPSQSLICRSCRQLSPVEENIPPDLFSLLLYHKIPQIHWFCKSCNDLIASPRLHQQLFSKIYELEREVRALKARRISSDYDEHDVRFNQSSSFRAHSTGSPLRRSDESLDFERSATPEPKRSFTNFSSLSKVDNQRSYSSSPQRSRSTSPRDQSIHSNDRSPERSKDKDVLRVIHKILADEIKIDSNQAVTSIEVVDAFMNELNPFLKKSDPVYKYLYSKDYKTGSSFNELKISSADEYDINIWLKPPKEFELKVEFFKETKAFSKIKWRPVNKIPESKECVLKFFQKISDDQGYLKPLKLKQWFHSIITKFCLSNPKIKGIEKFICSESGPARTIIIQTEQGYSISLDLVPVFPFGFEIFSVDDIPRLQEYPLVDTKAFCSFVPKVCDGEEKLLQEDCKLSWRTYIPEIDKKVLHNKQCAKPIIRLLKLLRDKQNWKSIASYHMVTVILWEIHENSSDENWKGKMLFDRFIEALEKLKEYLYKKHLPYFVYPEYNLFHSLNADEGINLSNRIKRIIKSLESDHNNLTEIFKLDS